MTVAEVVAWSLVGVELLQIVYLGWKLERARGELRELQAERVADVKWAAGLERREAEVDRVLPPEEAFAERVQEMDEDIARARRGEALSEEAIMDVLRERAREEGRKVSDSVLREDARRMLAGFSKSGQPPGV